MINKIYNENCLDTMARMPDNYIDTCSKKDVAYIYGKGIRRKFDKIKDAIEDHDLKLALHLIKNYKEEY